MSNLSTTPLFGADEPDEAPVYYRTRKIFGRKIWYFMRYEDVKFILGNHKLFGNIINTRDMNWLERIYETYEKSNTRFRRKSLEDANPPDHTRIRNVVNKAFSRKRMKALQPSIQEIVDGSLDELAKKKGGDILSDYAYPIAMKVLIKLLGFDEADMEWLVRLSDVLKKPQFKARNYLIGYNFSRRLRKIYAKRVAVPQDDLISMLGAAEKLGTVSHEEAIHSLYLMSMSGYVTTANLIGNAILALLLHPEELKKLQTSESITETAMDELFRYCNVASSAHVRQAEVDAQVGDVEVKRGDFVMVRLDGANYDQGIFENANQLDLDRAKSPHMAFGYGIHRCVGVPLAQLEGRIALNAIITRFPNMRLGVGLDKLSNIAGWNFWALEKLPVRWD